MRVASWLRVAAEPRVVKRSATVCVLVGTILVAINHGPQLVAGAISPTLLLQVVLTYPASSTRTPPGPTIQSRNRDAFFHA